MKSSHKTVIIWAGLIFLVTVLTYIPAMRTGYIWDDDSYVTENSTLRTADGLRRIWLDPKALPQYYPLVHTTFWVEYHLWQLHPFGYHLVNVLLHAFNAILLLLVLQYLRVPGAWLAAAFFALHPVHVESVAWITERKNVLSGFFYLSSALAYLRFANVTGDPANTGLSSVIDPLTSTESSRSWGFYAFSLFLFLCALLSKTVTCTLPAAILLVLWWKRGRIYWRDILALVPFFIAGAVLGLATVWLEKHHVYAQGEEWALSFVDRLLVAGRALWFYAGKLVWPHKLTFIYPRWQIDSGVWWQYLFPLAAVAVIFILWSLRRRIGKGPPVAVLFFAGTLVPALGFFDVYPMRFSFVADHFQYLASIGLIALAAAGITTLFGRLGPWQSTIGLVVCMAVLFVFGVLVWKQGNIYKNAETLYRDTISKNLNAWMAHNNLGVFLEEHGNLDEAMAHFAKAIKIKPDYAIAHYNMAEILAHQEKFEEAMAYNLEALRIKPDYPKPYKSLGMIYARQGKTDQAMLHFFKALRLNPYYASAHNNLGALLARQGKLDEGIAQLSEALRILPDYPKAHNNLGEALMRSGKINQAAFHLRQALKLKPDYPDPHNNLGVLLARQGKINEAIAHLSEAIRIEPDSTEAHYNLGTMLARQGDFEEAANHFRQALRLDPNLVRARRSLQSLPQIDGQPDVKSKSETRS
jgi:Flp pilus assembly protein TadD